MCHHETCNIWAPFLRSWDQNLCSISCCSEARRKHGQFACLYRNHPWLYNCPPAELGTTITRKLAQYTANGYIDITYILWLLHSRHHFPYTARYACLPMPHLRLRGHPSCAKHMCTKSSIFLRGFRTVVVFRQPLPRTARTTAGAQSADTTEEKAGYEA